MLSVNNSNDLGWWSIVPPLATLALAILTKQVFFSIFIGVSIGVLIFCVSASLGFIDFITILLEFIIKKVETNAHLLIFIMMMGALVEIINSAGGSIAFASSIQKVVHSKMSAQLMTFLFGFVLFIDDYFNALTNGNVMHSVCKFNHVSIQKQAQIVHVVASNVCVLIPITSWAAAIISEITKGEIQNPLTLFIQSIPYNFFSFLVFLHILFCIFTGYEYGPMKKFQDMAFFRESLQQVHIPLITTESIIEEKHAHLFDLLIPIISLITIAIVFMLYFGGFFNGSSLIDSFNHTDSIKALSLSVILIFFITALLYIPRKLLSFKEFMSSFTKGMQDMLPTLLILIMAWTMASVTESLLGTGHFLGHIIKHSHLPIQLVPCVIYIISALLTFSLGNAWGTFGIFIPIVIRIFKETDETLLSIGLASCLGGAVLGDQCSPISDTTVMTCASTGCVISEHIQSQIPYMLVISLFVFIGYIVSCYTLWNAWIILCCILLLLLLTLSICYCIHYYKIKKEEQNSIDMTPQQVVDAYVTNTIQIE
ncbi:hypothetical protein WA158_000640 [Blastocystis sp. Blastoise]